MQCASGCAAVSARNFAARALAVAPLPQGFFRPARSMVEDRRAKCKGELARVPQAVDVSVGSGRPRPGYRRPLIQVNSFSWKVP